MSLTQRLAHLAGYMESTAKLMQEQGGETADHGDELEGAAAMVHAWIKGLRGES